MLHVFVEGPDDEHFFSKYMGPVLEHLDSYNMPAGLRQKSITLFVLLIVCQIMTIFF